MFHSRIMNNKINWLHERCMRLIYEDKSSSFEELLEQDKSVLIHTRNLQILVTEMFKTYRSMLPPIFTELFRRRDYNLRSNSTFAVLNVKSVFHESKVRELTSLNAFKKPIKNGNQKIVLLGYASNTYQI